MLLRVFGDRRTCKFFLGPVTYYISHQHRRQHHLAIYTTQPGQADATARRCAYSDWPLLLFVQKSSTAFQPILKLFTWQSRGVDACLNLPHGKAAGFLIAIGGLGFVFGQHV